MESNRQFFGLLVLVRVTPNTSDPHSITVDVPPARTRPRGFDVRRRRLRHLVETCGKRDYRCRGARLGSPVTRREWIFNAAFRFLGQPYFMTHLDGLGGSDLRPPLVGAKV